MSSHLMLQVIKVESLRWHCKLLWDVTDESLLATAASKLNDSPEYLETTKKYVYLSLCIKLYWEPEQYYYNRNLEIVVSNKSHC